MANSLKKDDDNSHHELVEFYDSFVMKTQLGHEEARVRRQYVNNRQWDDEEIQELRRRKQPVITDNRIKRKTDYWLGIERQTRTDPKAFPREPGDEQGAEAATDALRFVCEKNDWDIERSEGFDALLVEGIEGYSIPVEQNKDGVDIKIRHIPWDRIIYDPYSRDRFFRDSKYKGIVVWLDKEDALAMFPKKEDVINGAFQNSTDEQTVFDDRPNKAVWSDLDRKRLKSIQLYYLKKGIWYHCVFTQTGYLIDPSVSKYLDEDGRPMCPIELGGAYIDEDNDRFGLVQDMMSLQDMVNKANSKYMHFLNSRQTWGNMQGPDAAEVKAQLSKPDGHVELKGGAKFGEDFGQLQTGDLAAGTFNLLQSALSSLAEIGGNSLVSSASGRSKEIDQQTSMVELGPVLDTHRQVSKHVYRQIWNRVQQFWTAEKWIRVTDDERNIKFVKLNEQQTYAQALMEKYGQIPPEAMGHPMLNQVAQVKNNTAELMVDIIIEESPDLINLQQEQFAIVAKLAETYGPQEVPFDEVLKLSQLRNKDQYIERTKGNEQQRQQNAQAQQQKQQQQEQMAQQAFMVEMRDKIASIEKKQAETELTRAKTIETEQDAGSKGMDNAMTQHMVQSVMSGG